MNWQKRLRGPDDARETIQSALSDAAGRRHRRTVAVYVWNQELDPGFPLAVLEYTARGDGDRMHWHDHLEIALVLDGRGAFLFGRRAMPAEPGDVFFIDNSQPHVALADDGTSLRLLLVLFRPELIAGPGCRELDLGYLAPFRIDERTASPRIRGGTPLAAEIAPVLQELRETWERHDPAEHQLADATLRRVLALVNRRRGADARGSAARAATDRREQIRPVLAYVDRHCRESITLDDVAEVVHVSPSRVRHVFKDVTGVSFKEYVTQVRVAEAKRLLLSTDLSVAEIARVVSYTNLNQFYKVFKDVTGVSFKEYVTQVRVAEAKRLLLSTDLSVAEIARAVSYTNLNQFYKVFYRSCAMSPGEYRRYYTPAGGEAEPDPGADSVADPAGLRPNPSGAGR